MPSSSTHHRSISSSRKVRAAAAATIMNVLLTLVKFILFFFTGSMAILAEACHSFTDIASSGLVWLAVKRSDKKSELTDELQPDEGPDRRVNDAIKFELFISLGIGILLAFVASSLIYKFFKATPRVIDNAVVAGLLFFVFSSGSYFIYRFETRIGKQEGSIGLFSDGMHARADMIASLLTGFSLILYALGVNLDRWVAVLIAVFIMSYAIETIINVILIIVRPYKDYQIRYRSSNIIVFLFSPTNIKQGGDLIKNFLESLGVSKKFSRIFFRFVPVFFCGVIALIYLSTAVYTIDVQETAVVERFGKPLSLTEPVMPGIHLKLPWPVDRVHKVKTAAVQEMNIGNITDKNNHALIWTRSHGTEEAFISGDNNFFYPYIVLHYRINDIFKYLYTHSDPKALISEAGHQIATKLFSKETFYNIATTHRKRLKKDMTTELQRKLDAMQCGIELLAVNFKDIHPPISIADSFERVIAGFQEKKKFINDALGYKNKVIPDARGDAEKRTEKSRSYIIDRTKKAEGSTTRFILLLPETALEKQVTMTRIHLQTLKNVLKDKKKIIIEPGSGEHEVWMDFESIVPTL